jgi:aarF domain-containing kinase
MPGKRLLDAAALFSASRAIAAQHLSIRLKQLDVYSKTSTLAKAVKGRTDPAGQATVSSILRFGSNAKAASPRQTYSSNSGPTSENLPSRKSVQNANDRSRSTEGLEQDHNYRPEDNAVRDEVPSEELDITQEKAKRHPLPDGTIPTGKTTVGKAKTDTEVYNKRPAAEPVKEPLDKNGSSIPSIEPESSARSSILDPTSKSLGRSELSPRDAKVLQRQSESQIPSKTADPPGDEAFKVKGAPGGDSTELGVDQERDTFYRAPDSSSPVLSALPRVKLPKNMGNIQGGDSHIKKDVNADVFYSSDEERMANPEGKQGAQQEPGEPSEEMVNQIFHSPRVARILGSKGNFGTLKPKDSPVDVHLGKGKNENTARMKDTESTVSTTSSNGEFQPALWATKENDDVTNLATDIAKDAGAPKKVSQDHDAPFCSVLIN